MTKSTQNQASLDQALLRAEQQLVELESLLTVLHTSIFDLETTPYGEPMDSAAWSDVMVLFRRSVRSANEELGPFCAMARERVHEAAKSEEAQS